MDQGKLDVRHVKTLPTHERFAEYLRHVGLSAWGAAQMLGVTESVVLHILGGDCVPSYEVRLRVREWTRTWVGGEIGMNAWVAPKVVPQTTFSTEPPRVAVARTQRKKQRQ
jgi:hypothetical protein